MPSLNVDLDYFDDPRTKRLIGLLGRGAEVLPIRLGCYCGKHHAESGRLDGYSEQEIEAIAGWWGKPGACIKEMVKAGFLVKSVDGYELFQWTEKQGHIHAYKLRAQHAAMTKWAKLKDATSIRQASLEHPSSNALSAQGMAAHGSSPPDGQELDVQIKQFFESHSGLLWSLPEHAALKKIIEGSSWAVAKDCVNKAIANRAGRPCSYALTVFSSEQVKADGKKNKASKSDDWKSKKYVPG